MHNRKFDELVFDNVVISFDKVVHSIGMVFDKEVGRRFWLLKFRERKEVKNKKCTFFFI
jgi:hypothetical protein